MNIDNINVKLNSVDFYKNVFMKKRHTPIERVAVHDNNTYYCHKCGAPVVSPGDVFICHLCKSKSVTHKLTYNFVNDKVFRYFDATRAAIVEALVSKGEDVTQYACAA